MVQLFDASAISPGIFRDRVSKITRDLIQIDTTNYGGNNSRGEPEAAAYCAALMEAMGMNPEIIESEPGRASVVGRMRGWDAEAPALVLHGHIDVVPADANEWSVDPFSAEVIDDVIYGRGAADMKGMDAIMLTALEHLHATGQRPQRDIILAFFADEEAGGVYGSDWLVTHRPELFDGATEAISEVGGFSATVAGKRAYFLQTAEKGIAWLNLTATGAPGHGSARHADNAVTKMANAIAAIGHHTWPLHYTATTRQLMEDVSRLMGVTFDESNPDPQLQAIGSAIAFVGSTLSNSSNPTGLSSGYKHNVIPGKAEATVDARPLPGQDDQLIATIRDLAGEAVQVEYEHARQAIEAPYSGPLVDAMIAAIAQEDPDAVVLPFMMSGGTDNNALSRLGIAGYGFIPLQLPEDLAFPELFHGIDERMPIDSLDFGVRALLRILQPQSYSA
ncbi:MAG TPA: M20/M25/M40 family metallo-hydrolase [Enteractinococcus helveticum]|uniref:M20/M25/M40 family metallo-hydrolase n=1 Tax=Enteractinococcus helveticum TaxID=1837282 RepID=A0A921FLV9_9MICC|nr:M20/M25/M40 family metallo-hydrolase [Enteractinococcus helveticum]HJF14580.1 M20/M25/M40 family metallo-hydrolase [Enteractinococcus helveticum]